MTMPERLRRFYRRWFGRYRIDDPRPIAARASYTYHLPSENELLALTSGDLVQLVFLSVPAGQEWAAERMWVSITAIEGEILIGRLDNTPLDMPQLRLGSPITFHRYSVIDIEWNKRRKVSPPASPARRCYWDRCLVDRCVTEGGVAVEYLYRETPDMGDDDDDHADSGWRIRGVEDVDFDRREAKYVALGRVLNADDSWLSLIDEPIGSAFLRNWQTGAFERVDCS